MKERFAWNLTISGTKLLGETFGLHLDERGAIEGYRSDSSPGQSASS